MTNYNSTRPEDILPDGVDSAAINGKIIRKRHHCCILSKRRMASLAQMGKELVAERTRAGLAAAKAKGRVGGRKRKMTQSKSEFIVEYFFHLKKVIADTTFQSWVTTHPFV